MKAPSTKHQAPEKHQAAGCVGYISYKGYKGYMGPASGDGLKAGQRAAKTCGLMNLWAMCVALDEWLTGYERRCANG